MFSSPVCMRVPYLSHPPYPTLDFLFFPLSFPAVKVLSSPFSSLPLAPSCCEPTGPAAGVLGFPSAAGVGVPPTDRCLAAAWELAVAPATVKCSWVGAAAFVKMNEPGSPTRGVSFIYSSPYLATRLSVSANNRASCTADDVRPAEPVPGSGDLDLVLSPTVACEPGIGVVSLLCCDDCCPSWDGSRDLGTCGK